MSINSELVFDGCRFSKALSDGGVDTHLGDLKFSQGITFNQCSFLGTLRITDSFFRDGLGFFRCYFKERLNVAQTNFLGVAVIRQCNLRELVSIEGIYAAHQFTFSDNVAPRGVIFQKGVFSGGLDISDIDLLQTGFIRLEAPKIIGSVEASRTFVSGGAGSLRIFPESRFDSFSGIAWRDFVRVFNDNRPQERLAVLPLVIKGYRSQGEEDEATSAFLEYKKCKADSSGIPSQLFHYFMVFSSNWGMDGMRLVKLFAAVVLAFGIIYGFQSLPLRPPLPTLSKRAFWVTGCLEMLVISLRMTLLQTGDDKLHKMVAEGRGDKDRLGRARAHIEWTTLGHSLVAVALLGMVAAYIGAQLSGT